MSVKIVDVREDPIADADAVHGYFVDIEETVGMWWWRKVSTRTLYRKDYNSWFDLTNDRPIDSWLGWEDLWNAHVAKDALKALQRRLGELRDRDTAGKNIVRTGPHR